jgi:hypothetical protein
MSEVTVRVDSEEYVVRREGGDLTVGRKVGPGGDVVWLDEVDPGLLSAEALDALDRGDGSDEALQIAVRGIVEAEVERGG